jgi:acyl transferase domain-containing protein
VLFATGDAAARLNETQYTQPGLFALEYALATLWRSWGIEPGWVMGHSVGECVAACVAGVFSLEDGLRLIAERGRLLQSLPRLGGMLAVAADEATVTDVISAWPADLSLAAVNEPRNTVVSGRLEALAAVAHIFASRGVRTTELAVSHAFHSPLVEPVLDRFLNVARTVRFSPPAIPVVSNVTGELAGDEIATPDYWRDHIRQPVRFQRGIQTLRDLGASSFLEIGPRPTLLAMGQACIGHDGLAWLPSLRPGRPDWTVMLESLRTLYLSGAGVDWRGFDQGYARNRVSLPTYPFQRQRYWTRRGAAQGPTPRPEPGVHPLLGHRLVSALSDVQFQSHISAAAPAYLDDHRVFQKVLLPAAAFLEMGLAAGKAVLAGQTAHLLNVTFHQPLELTGEPAIVQTIVSPDRQGWTWRVFRLRNGDESGAADAWTLHLSGILAAADKGEGPSAVSLSEKQALIAEQVDPDAVYDACAARGLQYGPQFRALNRVWRAGGEALAQLRLPDDLTPWPYTLHPVLIDAAFQLIAAVIGSSRPGTFVPAGVGRVCLHADCVCGDEARDVWAHVHVHNAQDAGAETVVADVILLSDNGHPAAEFRDLALRHADPALIGSQDAEPLGTWLYNIEWRPEGLRSSSARLALDVLPAAHEIAAPLVRQLCDAVSTPDMRSYGEGLAQLDRLGTAFVVRALHALGWDFQRPARFSRDELCSELGIAGQYRLLAARLLDLLADDSILARDGSAFRVLRAPAHPNPDTLAARIRRDHPEIEIELALLARCAGSLDQVLCGDTDPLQLLFPRGDLASAARLYQDTPGAQVLNAALGQAVTGFVRRMPWWRGVRILEIGAGTGGAAAGLLPLLPADSTEYVFTDVSAMFTEQAKLKFSEFGFVRYCALDIQRPPGEQGFAESQFDLIIAANVLHATPDIRRTLGHIRHLLSPGDVPRPSTCPAAAPEPMPVVRSAARPSMPLRWRAAPASSRASLTGLRLSHPVAGADDLKAWASSRWAWTRKCTIHRDKWRDASCGTHRDRHSSDSLGRTIAAGWAPAG